MSVRQRQRARALRKAILAPRPAPAPEPARGPIKRRAKKRPSAPRPAPVVERTPPRKPLPSGEILFEVAFRDGPNDPPHLIYAAGTSRASAIASAIGSAKFQRLRFDPKLIQAVEV